MQAVKLSCGGLNERGNGQRLFGTHGKIADAHLYRVEKGMWTDIPPYLLGVIEAVRLNEQVDEAFELGKAVEAVRNIRARKLIKNFCAIALQASLHAPPER